MSNEYILYICATEQTDKKKILSINIHTTHSCVTVFRKMTITSCVYDVYDTVIVLLLSSFPWTFCMQFLIITLLRQAQT